MAAGVPGDPTTSIISPLLEVCLCSDSVPADIEAGIVRV